MKIIGKPGGVARPYGYLDGPTGRIPITSASCEFAAGMIARCRVGIPPEFLPEIPFNATNDVYTLKVGDTWDGTEFTMFTGYIGGPSGNKGATSYFAAVDLIHIARDLDQIPLAAPGKGIVAEGVIDFRYIRSGSSVEKGVSKDFTLQNTNYFQSGGGPLPRQILDGLAKRLGELKSQLIGRQKEVISEESFAKAIALLRAIVTPYGMVDGSISSALVTSTQDSINGYIVSHLEQSFKAQSSIWDTLSRVFSDFGLYMLCNADGTVSVIADLANFEPPGSNYLDGSYIQQHNFSSYCYRNIKAVSLLSLSIPPGPTEKSLDTPATGAVVTFPETPDPKDSGALLSLQFPGWLTPISYATSKSSGGEIKEPRNPSNPGQALKDAPTQDDSVRAAQLKYAEMVYNYEKNKLRTFSVTGPLAPLAAPGTTTYIRPDSAVQSRNKVGRTLESAQTFSGFITEIKHDIEVQSKSLTTTFIMRNVSVAGDNLISGHPIFTDVKAPELK